MSPETALAFSWLHVLTKKRYDALRDVYGSLDEALKNLNEELLRGLGCRAETIEETLKQLKQFDAAQYRSQLEERGVTLFSIEDESYPTRLKEIGDPPIFLSYKGDLNLLDQPCIALVGTRRMTSYGKRVTELFVPPLVRAGCITVSGLALGIDAQVARETIAAGGRTVAVLGHGLGSIFPPSNEPLAGAIIENGGLLLSEFPLDMPPGKHTFPARNRIIAGATLSTIVLEAGRDSGALITADLALDYGRDVFAVPGQIFEPAHAGCHEMIAKALAKLVTSPEDVLQELTIAMSDTENVSFEPQNVEEASVWKSLTTMPQSVSDLVFQSGLEASIVNAQLTHIELGGRAKRVGNGEWVRA